MKRFVKVDYRRLNSRQKENFNYQKISAVLADYGFVTLRLSDDWEGADFIAHHISGDFLKVQLKARLCFYEKYRGKNLYIAFPEGGDWYLFPHDELLRKLEKHAFLKSESWTDKKGYSFPGLSAELRTSLEDYRITGATTAVTG